MMSYHFITAGKRSLRRLCIHRCLSVHRGGLLHCMLGYTPLWADISSLGRPPTRAYTPPGRSPWADTIPGRHPPGQTPPGQIPPSSACWDTVHKRAVRIPLECILIYIYFGRTWLCCLSVCLSVRLPRGGASRGENCGQINRAD